MSLSLVWDGYVTTTQTEQVDSSRAVREVSVRTDSSSAHGVRPRQLSKLSQTILDDERISDIDARLASIERMYPHVFDMQLEGGEVLVLVQVALKDVQTALNDFSNADLQTLSSRLSQVAAAMKKAQSLTYFNESFGAVVSFIRRATLSAVVADISLSALNALLSVLHTLLSNPMLNLDEASDLVERLSDEGWKGEHSVAGEILSALLDGTELDHAQIQTLLFPVSDMKERLES